MLDIISEFRGPALYWSIVGVLVSLGFYLKSRQLIYKSIQGPALRLAACTLLFVACAVIFWFLPWVAMPRHVLETYQGIGGFTLQVTLMMPVYVGGIWAELIWYRFKGRRQPVKFGKTEAVLLLVVWTLWQVFDYSTMEEVHKSPNRQRQVTLTGAK